MDTNNDMAEAVVLSSEQKQFVDNNGYLLIKNALPPDVVAEIDAAVDEVYAKQGGSRQSGSKRKTESSQLHYTS